MKTMYVIKKTELKRIKFILLSLIISSISVSCFNTKKDNKQAQEEYEWYEPDDPTPREQCPCCDYISLAERGNYLICPICFWEDDGLDIDQPDIRSGPNKGLTLREARANFAEFGACEKQMLQHVIAVKDRIHFKRKERLINDN